MTYRNITPPLPKCHHLLRQIHTARAVMMQNGLRRALVLYLENVPNRKEKLRRIAVATYCNIAGKHLKIRNKWPIRTFSHEPLLKERSAQIASTPIRHDQRQKGHAA